MLRNNSKQLCNFSVGDSLESSRITARHDTVEVSASAVWIGFSTNCFSEYLKTNRTSHSTAATRPELAVYANADSIV